MIEFIRAHGYDPGPTQRPYLAGAAAGLCAIIPGGIVFIWFGSFAVAADDVLRLPRSWTAVLISSAFVLAGSIYGGFFQRAADDRKAGWLFGLSYGFLLWVVAPIVVLPLIRGSMMAAGLAATGFFVAFLAWGLAAGLLFPLVHGPLHASLGSFKGGSQQQFGPDAAAVKSLLH